MSAQAPSIPGYGDGKLLGRGGYAVVYLYRDESRGEEVAVKVLTLLDDSARGQFADEIRVLSSFGDDPLIVPYLGQGTLADRQQPYFVMRYCPGGSLSKWVGAYGLPVAQVVETGLRIGRALEAVHRRSWLHRDIKPSNILVDEDGRAPRLSDFGIATPSRNGQAGPGDPAVSVAWSAPEVITKASRGSVASDVYALGATLWHLLVGHAPYEIPGGDNSPEALERRVVGSGLPGLGRDGVPTALEHLLRSMLEKDPAARPRRAADVVAVLELIDAQLQAAIVPVTSGAAQDVRGARGPVGSVPIPTAAGPAGPEPAKPSKRRVLIVCGAALLVVGGLVAAGSLSRHGTSGGGQASRSASAVATGPGAQDAGVLGDQVPPGTPEVTATRISSATLRFTWSYSAREATDSFSWRVVGTSRSGATSATSIDLSDPAGQRMCIQVRVVRAGGEGQGSSWSAAGCGS
ncbi:serine/threonine protein kinase [Actinospica sp. MGRD01-02]|uniref:non-specific serine/threonine protein kinase n=1 Tax=Actinospica acidithermotolerans TaxID=2828514 RepID=A0A941EJ20_9ACTN|nr:serine/threonine-protein kinase [Actinospica acidithermotolerans]MBR7828544.1 serine/threonine protein kinase [Actinospica acidithermotolerans]